MRPAPVAWILAAVTLTAFGTTAGAQDFHKNYSIPAGGRISVGNISGNITVTGYDGDTIMVAAFKEGRDRDLIEIEDASTADRVAIKVRYPEKGNAYASVHFELRAPRRIDYTFEQISSVSGNVRLEGVTGRLRASSVSGNVEVRDFAGPVNASTVSGDVNVEITRLEGAADMKFASVSGSVSVKAPSNLDAAIEMSSVSGSVKSDFPIEIQERRYGPGSSARGRLGSGSRNLKISTVSGRAALLRQ